MRIADLAKHRFLRLLGCGTTLAGMKNPSSHAELRPATQPTAGGSCFMTENEFFEKNFVLTTEFDRYLVEHPEVAEQIP
jgi:hypothetical protein